MTTAFGRPVEGDINRYTEAPPPQHDPALFIEALDELLDTPGVEAVRWEQYTPYFNDGDACLFSVHESRVKISGNKDEGEYEDLFLGKYDLYDYQDAKRVWNQYDSVSGQLIAAALDGFAAVIGSGNHDVVLTEQFGDPAQVTATKDGFVVEHYEHD